MSEEQELKESDSDISKRRVKKSYGKSILRLLKRMNKKDRMEATGDSTSTVSILQSKDVLTDDKLTISTSEVKISRSTKERDMTTQMNMQTTRHGVDETSLGYSSSDPSKLRIKEKNFKNLFTSIRPNEINLRSSKDRYKFNSVTIIEIIVRHRSIGSLISTKPLIYYGI
jgi:hypothetical protein